MPAIVQVLATDRIAPGAMTTLGLVTMDDILDCMPIGSISRKIAE